MQTTATTSGPARTELSLAQAAWDLFFNDALLDFDDPNLELRRDRALDKTIRALGQRPRPPLTPEEREELALQHEVQCHFDETGRVPNIGRGEEEH